MQWSTEFKYFQKLIQNTDGCIRLKMLNNKLKNLYKNGVFTSNQYAKLDILLFDKQIEADIELNQIEKELQAELSK